MRNSGKYIRRVWNVAQCRCACILHVSAAHMQAVALCTDACMTVRISWRCKSCLCCSKCEMIMGMHQIPHYSCEEADCPSKWAHGPQQAAAVEAA